MASSFSFSRRVEFADTDAAGLIHFTALLKYLEEAEHAFYRSFGFSAYRRTESDVFGMPRVSVSCDYLGPVRYGELVEVRLTVREARTKAIRYTADVAIEREGTEHLVARGDWTVVCAERDHGEPDWRGTDIPDELRAGLHAAADPGDA